MDPWAERLRALSERLGGDVYLHSGPIVPPSDDTMIGLACRPRQARAFFFVATYGGHARSAYRMMRCLRHAYEHITVLISGPCKSAGTLLAIGADELVMTGGAELGPLDVQILKDGELLARQSGLTPEFAFATLGQEALRAFGKAFIDMKLGGRLTTTAAADTAAKLTIGLFAPIFAQIDPIRVGEWSMAHLVAHKYAVELTSHETKPRANIVPAAIVRLLSGYPSHDYVIDRQEAKELFKIVRHPTEDEIAMLQTLGNRLGTPAENPITLRLTPAPTEGTHDHPPASSPEDASSSPERTPDDGAGGSGAPSGAPAADEGRDGSAG